MKIMQPHSSLMHPPAGMDRTKRPPRGAPRLDSGSRCKIAVRVEWANPNDSNDDLMIIESLDLSDLTI